MLFTSLVSKFFLFCSGVSKDIIIQCPKYEIIKYSTIGVTIFFTSILAFISSFFALSLMFESPIFIILGAIFWSLIIFNLDRYIVISLRPSQSIAKNFILAFPRLLIALIISVVISKPIEIKLFEKELANFFYSEKTNKIQILEEKINFKISKTEKNKEKINLIYIEKKKIVDKYKEDYLCEANGNCGTMLRGRGLEYESRKQRWISENNILKLESKKKDSLIKLENLKAANLKNQYLTNKNKIINHSYGFFDKTEALKYVNRFASNFILLIFVLVEVSPVLTKLLSKKGPYDALVMKSEIEYETDYLNSLDAMESLKTKNKILRQVDKEIQLKTAEIDLKMKQNGLKNISRQEAFERYEELKRISSSEE